MTVYNKLPVPYTYNGTKVEFFQPNSLELVDIKNISNMQNKRNFPMKWIAETVCRSIFHMGGVNVFEEFSKDINNIPPIVLAMPMISTSNVLVAGHIETLGSVLSDIPMKCPNRKCGKEEEIDIDLAKVTQPSLEKDYEEYLIEGTIDKSIGYKISANLAEKLGFPKDISFNNFVFRLPTLGDSIKCEEDFNFDDTFDFMCRLLSNCIVKLSSDDGEELPNDVLMMQKDRIIQSLKPRAIKDLITCHRRATPEYELQTNHICTNCKTKYTFSVDNSFLFQMV